MLLPESVVNDADFVSLFRFVVDMGGKHSPYIEDLQLFTSKFVDPKAHDTHAHTHVRTYWRAHL